MPISFLTDGPRSYIKLGNIRKGQKDEDGVPQDLDYFRVTFMKHPYQKEIEKAFRSAYGDRPVSINVKFAFPSVREVFDANHECYKQGGLYWKAGSTQEKGAYWIYYRDSETAEVHISNGMPRTETGADLLSRPVDIFKPLYVTKDKKGADVPHYLSPVGRLEVVIEELADIAVGYFEFRPESPRDIRNISVELSTYEFMASQFGKSLLGIPFKLFRREETVPKRVGKRLTPAPSWVVHIEANAEWNSKALQLIDRMALPEIVDGDIQELLPAGEVRSIVKDADPIVVEPSATPTTPTTPAPPVVKDDDPIIDARGMWAVDYVRSEWSLTAEEAVKKIVALIGTKSKISKAEFIRQFKKEE